MPNKLRRTRTGCLTCRARRVKCDEQSPECRRCIAANIDCAGYEQRRVIIPVKPSSTSGRRVQTSLPRDSRLHTTGIEPSQEVIPNVTKSQALVALPSNPRPCQHVGPGARHVLGYHQALLRTVPILFAAEHLTFWRDGLFQEAWSCEYLYLTIVGLGNIHRAVLMTASPDEREQANGLDMKITAVQFYTQALDNLANQLEEAKKTPALLVATLCLMAYFESFSGNLPAFIGRVQAAHYYSMNLVYFGRHDNPRDNALRECLCSLSQTCYVALPLSRLHDITGQHVIHSSQSRGKENRNTSTILSALRGLVDMISEDQQIKQLVWSPIAPYARDIPANTIRHVENRLRDWKDCHLHLIPELDTEPALNSLLVYKWQRFTMPPPAYSSTAYRTSLTAAHYNFYMARMKWALLLLEDNTEQNQLMAEFYFCEVLRHAASLVPHHDAEVDTDDAYIPGEALNVGILPVLHITGLCSPQLSWLRWIQNLCNCITREGVLKGHTFATNLSCLHTHESRRHGDPAGIWDQFPAPAERVICQLIPEMDGRHYTSFFAAPTTGIDPQREGLGAYRVIGSARWKCNHDEGPCTPEIKVFDEESITLESFSTDWLYNTQNVLDWLSWSQEKEFRMDRALQDHISGTLLLTAVDEATSSNLSPKY